MVESVSVPFFTLALSHPRPCNDAQIEHTPATQAEQKSCSLVMRR
jgi:hypothetical protein